MRTTVTLDPDVEALVKQAMRERGLTFNQAVNDAIRAGMKGGSGGGTPELPVFDMGESLIDVTEALRLADELEDAEPSDGLAGGA
jgi:hypothetical protein